MTPPVPRKRGSSPIRLGHRYSRWLYRRAERHVLLGIPVGLDSPSAETRATVVPKLEAALQLLREHDPRRFARLHRDIDGVLIQGHTRQRVGAWIPSVRLVELPWTYLSAPDTSAAEVASTLVHEGTHAWLHHLGIDTKRKMLPRIEAICFRSEIAFARRLPEPGDLIEQAERQLARDTSYWSHAAWQQQSLAELNELGVPLWLTALFARLLAARDRVLRIFLGPPPH